DADGLHRRARGARAAVFCDGAVPGAEAAAGFSAGGGEGPDTGYGAAPARRDAFSSERDGDHGRRMDLDLFYGGAGFGDGGGGLRGVGLLGGFDAIAARSGECSEAVVTG